MNPEVSKYFSRIGYLGGKAGTGKAKSRGSEHAKRAAAIKWAKWERDNNKKTKKPQNHKKRYEHDNHKPDGGQGATA